MSERLLILSLCVAEVLGMLGISTFPALLPTLQAEWGLSNAQAGWITGVYYGGYMCAVPVLVGLTDRVDARGIYLVSTALAGLGLLGFAVLAEGFWSALVFRAIAGVALAGTYMPGLKALTDRIAGAAQPRAVAFYTSSFGIGVSASFLFSGEVAEAMSWQWAFGISAVGAPVAILLAGRALAARPASVHPAPETHLLDFRPVFRNRPALAYILAYTAHNWELFGVRGWLVAFLVFSQTLQPEYSGWSATWIATAVTLLGVPASIVGGECALHFGRRRVVMAVMTTSALFAVTIGFTAALPFPVIVVLALVYAPFIAGDSAAITTGAVRAAPEGGRGAVMAMHSFIGFAGAFTGPLAFGVVLDVFGAGTPLGWGLAFATLGLAVFMGPVVLALMARGRPGGG
ncbi:MAG: nitrate/nitrite transporter [Alphaproteobacteria bacterium]